MKYINMKLYIFLVLIFDFFLAIADNQTNTVSDVVLDPKLPFILNIELAPFSLPVGLQAGSIGLYNNQLLYIGGRLNGLHGFGPNNNFPPNQQNTNIYVFDLTTKVTYSRALNNPQSGLTQAQIDTLAVTSPQFYQKNNTLYITGGYGFDTDLNTFNTKPILTAINILGLIHWVKNPSPGETASQYIRQITDPTFRVTGGAMNQIGNNPTLLIFGQNFDGEYTPSSTGIYTNQVRKFHIFDDGQNLSALILSPSPEDPNFRRRDLNVVSRLIKQNNLNILSFVALSGVFTLSGGVWTVPVEITASGNPSMADPNLPTTFKQGMNNYRSAKINFFSEKENSTYIVILGGLTYEYFSNGEFLTDPQIPFTNQVTALKIDKYGNFTQYLLNSQYPFIESTFSNPGNQLLFGTQADFIPIVNPCLNISNLNFPNHIINLDKITKPLVIGYIIGGIQSTLPNTNTMSDTAASPYIFQVTLTPTNVIPSAPMSPLVSAIKTKYCDNCSY